MKGLVLENTGSWYVVQTDDNQLIDCKIKGNFRLKGIRSTNPVAVGDRVVIQPNAEGTAFISEIEDRKNYIIRKASNLSKQSHILAANLDQAFLVVTVSHPETSTTFIDRFLASAEAYRVPVCLIFNKTDCYDEAETSYMNALVNLYETIGYSNCFCCSALNKEGIEALHEAMTEKITLLSGNSKMKIYPAEDALLPGIDARKQLKFHMHTTRVCTQQHSAKCLSCHKEDT